MHLLKKAQAAAGASVNDRPIFSKPQSEAGNESRSKTVVREHGTLRYRAPQQMRDESGKPLKLEGGEKFQYGDDEQKEFTNTDYANGMLVSVYEGEIRDQRRDGTGTYTYTKGETFDGAWRNDKRHGQGVLSMTTGHRYEGDWQNDTMSGAGREQFVKGEIYTGTYANGRMSGNGILDYNTTGTLFEGEWLDGRKHGKGRILYGNGDIFEGTWQHGRRHGRGTTTYAKGGKVYSSQWVDGRMVDGMKFVSGPPTDAGATFSGQTVPNEKGIQIKTGPGTVRFSNGDTFEGNWVDGKREGQATIRYAKGGRTYSSNWRDGQLIGDMIYQGESSNPFQSGSPQRNNSQRRRIKLDKTTILPLDISKWKPKKNISRPSTDSFLRLQLAFEALDKDSQMCIRVSSLSEALTSGSGSEQQFEEILQAADRDNTGDVDLYSLLRAWYPQALRSDVDKYLATFITPKELLQHRGEVCGVPSSNKGFIHVADGGGELSLETLLIIGSAIGTERFTETQFRKSIARTDKETVNFVGLLDVWYENVPIDMIARSELTYLPEGDLDSILDDFNKYQQDGNLAVQEFKEAQDRYQLWLAQYDGASEGEVVPFLSLPSTPQDELHFAMLPGAFKGEPYWPLGPITLTVRMLEVIDKMQGRWVELVDLLCFNYPNISCSHTKERFLDRKPAGKECQCEIHQSLSDIN